MKIAAKLLADLCAKSAAVPRHEICGLLLGSDERIEEARSATNVSPNPSRTFEIDPQALISALRAERAGEVRVIGCYHSHPSDDATPSARDVAAAEPGKLWLIVAGGEARLWRAKVDGFDEVALRVV